MHPAFFPARAHQFLLHALLQPGVEGLLLIPVDLVKDDEDQLFKKAFSSCRVLFTTPSCSSYKGCETSTTCNRISSFSTSGQCAFEAFDQVVRQVANEADGIAEQERSFLKNDFAGSGV